MENFKRFMSEEEDNDPKMPQQIAQMLEENGYYVDQYLGGGKYGSVYQVESKKDGRRVAVKVVDGAAAGRSAVKREVDNYQWIVDNKDRLPEDVAKHLPDVYSTDIAGDYGIIFMELLDPDKSSVTLGLFLGGEMKDPKTGEDRMQKWSKINRAERLLDNDAVRKDIVMKMLKGSTTLVSVIGMIAGIGNDKGMQLFEKLAEDASNKYANEYFGMQKARRAKRSAPAKNLPDITLERLKESEYLAQLFAQIIINAWDASELVEEILKEDWAEPVVKNIRADLQRSFVKEYTRGIMTLGSEKLRTSAMDFYYQHKDSLKNFPEVAGLVKALAYLDEKEGFEARDVHAMNVMFSKKTREMVVVDLGLFSLGKKQKDPEPTGLTPSELKPFELVLENFKQFLNEDVIPWPKLLRMAAASYEQAKSIGESLGIENFDEEFLLKLVEYWEKQIDPEEADPDDPDPYGEYSNLYWNEFAGSAEGKRNVQNIFNMLMKKYGSINVIQNDRQLNSNEKYLFRIFWDFMREMRGMLGPEVENYPKQWQDKDPSGKTVYFSWEDILDRPWYIS